MSLSNGKVSSDVHPRRAYLTTTCIMTPVSDLVMLFFFKGEGTGQRCMTCVGDTYDYLPLNYSEWKD